MSDYVLLPPVEFDFQAAEAAAEACRQMASQLDLVLEERARAAEQARADWSGSARQDFDTIAGALGTEGADLRTDLLNTAGQIEAAAGDVRAENGRRQQENVRRREEAERATPPTGPR